MVKRRKDLEEHVFGNAIIAFLILIASSLIVSGTDVVGLVAELIIYGLTFTGIGYLLLIKLNVQVSRVRLDYFRIKSFIGNVVFLLIVTSFAAILSIIIGDLIMELLTTSAGLGFYYVPSISAALLYGSVMFALTSVITWLRNKYT